MNNVLFTTLFIVDSLVFMACAIMFIHYIEKKLDNIKRTHNLQCIHDWSEWKVAGINLIERECLKCGKIQVKHIEDV